MTTAAPSYGRAHSPRLTLQRCACGGAARRNEECAECKRKRLQRSAVDAAPAVAPPIVHQVLREPGQPLDGRTRDDMESHFGHDFASVRVHTDARAADSARAVSAHAYTVGRHVVFGAGGYAPSTAGGRKLLAHELAHTIQQEGAATSVQALAIDGGSTGALAEREAESAAANVDAGRAARVARSPGAPALRRAINATARGALGGCGICFVRKLGAKLGYTTGGQAAHRLLLAAARAEYQWLLTEERFSNKKDKGNQELDLLASSEKAGNKGLDAAKLFGLLEGSSPAAPKGKGIKIPDLLDPVAEEPDESAAGAMILAVGEIKPDSESGRAEGVQVMKEYNAAVRKKYPKAKVVPFTLPLLPISIPFKDPFSPKTCPKQTLNIEHWKDGIHLYYCDPPYKVLVTKPECNCDDDEKKKKKKEEKRKKEEAKKEEARKKDEAKKDEARKKDAAKKEEARKKEEAKRRKADEKARKKGLKKPKAGNFGIGISLGGSSAGGGNAGIGVSINSSSNAVGTAGVGISYDSNGNAIGTVGAGVSVRTSSNAAGAVGAGATKDSDANAVGVAGAGSSNRSNTNAAGAAGAGSSEDVNANAAGVTGQGTAKNVDVDAAGTSGSGTAKDVTGTAVGTSGSGAAEGVEGDARGTPPPGSVPGTQGKSGGADAGTEEGTPGGTPGGTGASNVPGDGGTTGESGTGTGAGKTPPVGAGIPGGTVAGGGTSGTATTGTTTGTTTSTTTSTTTGTGGTAPQSDDFKKAVAEAQRAERALASATAAQLELLRQLAVRYPDATMPVPDAVWVEQWLAATAHVTPEQIPLLMTVEWQPPTNISPEEFKRRIDAILAGATTPAQPTAPDDAKKKAADKAAAEPAPAPDAKPKEKKKGKKKDKKQTADKKPEDDPDVVRFRGYIAKTADEAKITQDQLHDQLQKLAADFDFDSMKDDEFYIFADPADPDPQIARMVYRGKKIRYAVLLVVRIEGKDAARKVLVLDSSNAVTADGRTYTSRWVGDRVTATFDTGTK